MLDSVVGVFLTQNVSDALSSKAWMTLAATFNLTATNGREQVRGRPSAITRVSVWGWTQEWFTGIFPPTCLQNMDMDAVGNATMAGSRSKRHAEQKMNVQGTSAAKTQAVHRFCCSDTADSIDWEAVRVAPTEQVSGILQIAPS